VKYKKVKYDRDVQRLMRERKFPKQLRWLYDYFWRAENDERARGEELLRGYAEEWPTRYFSRKLTRDQAAYFESMRDDEGLEMYEIVDRLETSKAREDRSLLNALVTIAAAVYDLDYLRDTPTTCGEDQPSWNLLNYSGAGYGWLVHFGRDASAIAYEGFDKGVYQVDKLALTHLHCGDYTDHEGYNFAYRAEVASRYGFDRGSAKYGDEAVIFQAPYLLFYHDGDQEPQCILLGSVRTQHRTRDRRFARALHHARRRLGNGVWRSREVCQRDKKNCPPSR
jgi:hypothetical protein